MKTLLALTLIIPNLSWGKTLNENFTYFTTYACGELFDDVNNYNYYELSAFDLQTIQLINFDIDDNIVVQWGDVTYKSWEKTIYPHTYTRNGGEYSLDVEKIGSNTFVMNFTRDSKGFPLGNTGSEYLFYQIIFDRNHLRFEGVEFEDGFFSNKIFEKFQQSGKCLQLS